MIERRGDLWADDVEGWEPGDAQPPWLVVTTNGERKTNGHAVMGAGVAKQAAKLFPVLPQELGSRLRDNGNRVYHLGTHRLPGPSRDPSVRANHDKLVRVIVSFPTKHRWREASDIDLIDKSARELVALVAYCTNKPKVVVLPRPGTLNGRLAWSVVKPVLEERLKGDRYVVVSQ
jgi:hypothetical protein